MAKVLIEISDDGNGGITYELPGEYKKLDGAPCATSAAQNAAIFVTQQLKKMGVTMCPCCHGDTPSCGECGGTGRALLAPRDEGAAPLLSDVILNEFQFAAGENDPAQL